MDEGVYREFLPESTPPCYHTSPSFEPLSTRFSLGQTTDFVMVPLRGLTRVLMVDSEVRTPFHRGSPL